eukprot:TRINITY_DN6344_c0_g2_i1.p1 TRINITY_DN6344_c0_g2~~TRINITY_DN6344_c0_g2_i1.p1  ORF type:complete len:720 (+),score=123.69 TRINITY_DN6344_c0_g2_i1:68-2227(+)
MSAIYWPCAAKALQSLFCKTGKPLEACLGEQGVVAALKSLDSIEFRTPEQKHTAGQQLLNLLDHLLTHLEHATPSKIGLFSRAFQAILKSNGLREECYKSQALRRRYRIVTLKALAYVKKSFEKQALCRLTSNLCLFLLGFVATSLPRVQELMLKAINEAGDEDDDNDGIDDSSRGDTESDASASNRSTKTPRKRASLVEQLQPDQRARFDTITAFWGNHLSEIHPRIESSHPPSAAASPPSSPKQHRRKRKASNPEEPRLGLGEACYANFMSLGKLLILVGDHLLVTPKDPVVESTFLALKTDITADGEDQDQEEELDAAGDSSWLRWIRGWSTNYHTFALLFVDAFYNSSSFAFDFSDRAYRGVIHSFLAWMCSSPHPQWDPTELTTVSGLIEKDQTLVMPFLKIVMETTNALDKVHRANLFDILESWMPHIIKHVTAASPRQADKIFDPEYFIGIMHTLLLDMDHYATAQQVLALLYNSFDAFRTPTALSALAKLLIDDGFMALFLHWSAEVRAMYITFIHDRFLAPWVLDAALASHKASLSSMMDSLKATSTFTQINDRGLLHFSPQSPKSPSRKRKHHKQRRQGHSETAASEKEIDSIPLSRSVEVEPTFRRVSIDSVRKSVEIPRPRKGSSEVPMARSVEIVPPSKEHAKSLNSEPPASPPMTVPAHHLPYVGLALKQFEEYASESGSRGAAQPKILFKDPMALQILMERWSN